MSLKEKMYVVIFEADTPAGKAFDVGLIIAVFLSILGVMLETVESIKAAHPGILNATEWFFTALFTLELMLRLYCTDRKLKYLFSFYGLVDIISILPNYLAVFMTGGQSFLIVRALRMLRIFRILKLKNYTTAGQRLSSAIAASLPKIVVFLGFVLTFVLVIGAFMYMIEGREAGFTSIPKAVYWAIVTMTTVGYGDITPRTPLGQVISSLLMIIGYGIIAVPTGLVSVELTRKPGDEKDRKYCPHCQKEIN